MSNTLSRRMIATIGLTALVVGISPWWAAAPPAQAARAQQVVIGDFESADERWSKYPAGGASGSLERVNDGAAKGEWLGRLSASVPPGGNYEVALPVAKLDADALEFSVRSSEVRTITVRVVDALGQTHHQQIPLDVASDGWQRVRLNSFVAGRAYSSYKEGGEPGDGRWYGKLQKVSIVLDSWSFLQGKTSGTLDIDYFAAELEPIRLQTLVTGNVFTTGDEVQVGVETEADQLSWIVRDGYGNVVEENSAYKSTLGGVIPLDVDGAGWYEVEVYGTDASGVTQRAGTDVAVLDTLPADFVRDERLGMATHYGQEWLTDTVPLLGKAGHGLGRDEAYWAAQEKNPGQPLVWQDKVDAYESAFRQEGVDHLRVLSYGNGNLDAAGNRPYCSTPNRGGDFGPYDCAPVTDAERDGFARYALKTVEKLTTANPGKVNYFEIWNEWNLRQRTLKGSDYALLVQRVQEVVRAEYPDVKLVAGALAPYDSEGKWQQWVRDFVGAGGLTGIDYFSTHPYADIANVPNEPELSPTNFKNHWTELREVIGEEIEARNLGIGVPPIMISETGWGTQTDERGVSESDQAKFVTRGVLYALADGIANITIYDLMDDGLIPSDREDRLGLIRYVDDKRGAYVPKPAYVASAVANRAIAGLAHVAGAEGLGEKAWVEEFTSESKSVRAAWALEPTNIAVAAEGEVRVTGMFGEVTTLVPDASGKVYITLTDRPVYLLGDITGVERSDRFALAVEQETTEAATAASVTVTNDSARATSIQVDAQGGSSANAVVEPGQSAELGVSFRAQESGSERRYTVVASESERPVALLHAVGTPAKGIVMSPEYVIEDKRDVLQVTVTNSLPRTVTLTGLDLTAQGVAERLASGTQLAPGESIVVRRTLAKGDLVDYSIVVGTEDGFIGQQGEVRLVQDPVYVPRGAITVDGAVDEATSQREAIEVTGTNNDGQPIDPVDASADLWFSHDDDNLYVTVQVTDNLHNPDAAADRLWNGDGVQIGLVEGAPGERAAFQELGFALGDDGETLTYRWLPRDQQGVPEGLSVDAIKAGDGKSVVYEAAIPWSLVGIDPTHGFIGSAVVVNDTDGEDSNNDGIRDRQWLNFGDGIATAKDPGQFAGLVLDD